MEEENHRYREAALNSINAQLNINHSLYDIATIITGNTLKLVRKRQWSERSACLNVFSTKNLIEQALPCFIDYKTHFALTF